jgi:hypothetical protein
MSPIEKIIEVARDRPHAVLLDGSFRDYVAFFSGGNVAAGWLHDFSSWIAARHGGYGANLVWPVIVMREAGIEPPASRYWRDLTPADDARVVATFFELLAGFLARPHDAGS